MAPASGFTRPVTVAVSVSVAAPSGARGDAVAATPGTALTMVVLPGALQAVSTEALLASPLYVATQR